MGSSLRRDFPVDRNSHKPVLGVTTPPAGRPGWTPGSSPGAITRGPSGGSRPVNSTANPTANPTANSPADSQTGNGGSTVRQRSNAARRRLPREWILLRGSARRDGATAQTALRHRLRRKLRRSHPAQLLRQSPHDRCSHRRPLAPSHHLSRRRLAPAPPQPSTPRPNMPPQPPHESMPRPNAPRSRSRVRPRLARCRRSLVHARCRSLRFVRNAVRHLLQHPRNRLGR